MRIIARQSIMNVGKVGLETSLIEIQTSQFNNKIKLVSNKMFWGISQINEGMKQITQNMLINLHCRNSGKFKTNEN